MLKFSVVIPSSGDPFGLWSTVLSAHAALEAEGLAADIVPVIGEPNIALAREVVNGLPRVRAIEADHNMRSPQAARDWGMKNTTTEAVVFLDSHVQIPAGFFGTLVEDLEATGAGAMSTWHRFTEREPVAPGCSFGELIQWVTKPKHDGKPFRVAMHSHGAFAVRREAYDMAGGYWDALKGFGGEEPQLSFKLWLMGSSCWTTPRTFHWHYIPTHDGRHDYAALFYDYQYVSNHLMVAAAYDPSGEQLKRSWEWLLRWNWKGETVFPELDKLVLNSREVRYERQVYMSNGKYPGGLPELRNMFSREGIFH